MSGLELNEALAKTDKLFTTLSKRQPEINKRLNYFRGKTGQLKFASEKFGEYFTKQFEGFSDNWCMPVAQAPAERMGWQGIRPYGKASGADKALEKAWHANDGERGFAEAALVFGVASRAFSLVSPTSDPETPRLTWEHPEQAIVETDPATGVDRFGLITWVDEDNDYATLYTPFEVWKFQRGTNAESNVQARFNGWKLRDGVDGAELNPLGEVPLTELRNQTLLDDDPISDISGVMAMQDSINLVWAYLLNALDYASLPGRVVTGADLPEVEVLDKDGQVAGKRNVELDQLIKERILWVPDAEAKIAEWSAAQLDAFSAVIERAVEHIAAQTRTPPHYLVAKMVNTAAESLNIAEAGLVSKTQERLTYVNPAMKKTQRLMARAQGADQKRITAINAGTMLWDGVQYRSDAQLADAMGKLRTAGFPFEYIAERVADGNPAEVRRIMKMKQAELAADPLAQAQLAMQTPGA